MPKIYSRFVRIAFLFVVAMLTTTVAMSAKSKSKDFVVVIDAGHGGKDTGAVDNKATEKEINLGVAKRLKEYLEKKKGFKVIMTRDGDKFVGLQERANKANKANADLFISIHTNSLDASNENRKNVEGASVYVLGLHRDADNLAVARRENEVISKEKNHEEHYEGFDPSKDESYIIFEMAQKKNLSKSIGFAQGVQKELVKAGRKDRGVHQAGFLVLRETAMPSVLIELDFICNPNAARYLNSSSGQKRLANAIANAVVAYRDNLKKSGDKAYANATLDAVDNSGDIFVLVSTKSGHKRTDVAPKSDNGKRTSTLPRKRRSESSRRASSQRNLSTEHIPIPKEQPAQTISQKLTNFDSDEDNTEHAAQETVTAASTKKSQNRKTDNKKEDKKKDNDKKAKKENDDENYRTYGNKRVRVNVRPGSSSVVSLKSDKPASEKQASTARYKAPAEEKPAASPKKFVDKKAAEQKAKAEDEKRRLQAEAKTKKDAEKKRKSAEEKKRKEEEKNRKLLENQHKYASKDGNKHSDSEENQKKYEAAKQKSSERNQTTAAPRSLKSKKRN